MEAIADLKSRLLLCFPTISSHLYVVGLSVHKQSSRKCVSERRSELANIACCVNQQIDSILALLKTREMVLVNKDGLNMRRGDECELRSLSYRAFQTLTDGAGFRVEQRREADSQ